MSDIVPWTRGKFMTELRRAGWKRMNSGSGATYISPDDSTVLFTLDNYRPGIGVLWRYFAGRHELPSTTRPPF